MLELDYLYNNKQKLITRFLKTTARHIHLTDILRTCLKVMICRTGENITEVHFYANIVLAIFVV